jgi:predicted molibdopterin-dependent oxidoreductase YjgC
VAISVPAPAESRTISLSIDGQSIEVPEGTTIWDAAKSAGIEIPVLCHDERYDPVGMCRMCAVDVGGRVYAAAASDRWRTAWRSRPTRPIWSATERS